MPWSRAFLAFILLDSPSRCPVYALKFGGFLTGVAFVLYNVLDGAEVAQLVEQRTENPRVPSSILGLGTIMRMRRKWLSGRASPCQGEGREFESRLPLQGDVAKWIRRGSAKPLFTGSNPVVASSF